MADLKKILEEIAKGIESIETIAGRNHIIKTNQFTVVDDCYNANPISMKASIDVIDTALGRKVCILGDMFELGENVSEEISKGALYYMKKNSDAYNCSMTHFDTKEELLSQLKDIIVEKDNILIKASHGMEFSKIVENIVNM